MAQPDTPDRGDKDHRKHDQKRVLTEEEKLDETIAESFIGSDPPANSAPTRVGAPPKRKSKKPRDNS